MAGALLRTGTSRAQQNAPPLTLTALRGDLQLIMGAGGNVTQWRAGSYSEATVTLTESLMSRSFERAGDSGFPSSRYVENVGVRPDFEYDYMAQQNLFESGKPFVDAFTAAMVEHIRRFR